LGGGALMHTSFQSLASADDSMDDPGNSEFGATPAGAATPDKGTLRPDTRRVVVQLVKGPYVMRTLHPNLWASLENDEEAVRQTLGNLFLELVLNRDVGLAFARNLDTGESGTKFFRSTPLTLIDTALVLLLRERLLRSSDGRAFVGADEIVDQLRVYGTASRADPAGTAKRIQASIEKMKKNSVLIGTDEDGRFEISPVLAMVFGANQVRAVVGELRNLLSSGATVADESDEAPAEDGDAA